VSAYTSPHTMPPIELVQRIPLSTNYYDSVCINVAQMNPINEVKECLLVTKFNMVSDAESIESSNNEWI